MSIPVSPDDNRTREFESNVATSLEEGPLIRRAYGRLVRNFMNTSYYSRKPRIMVDTFRIRATQPIIQYVNLDHSLLIGLSYLVHQRYPTYMEGSIVVNNIYAKVSSSENIIRLNIVYRGRFRKIHDLDFQENDRNKVVLYPSPSVIKYSDGSLHYYVHLPYFDRYGSVGYRGSEVLGPVVQTSHAMPIPWLSTNTSENYWQFLGVEYLDLQCTFNIGLQ